MSRVVVVVQARLGSTRLPGKVLKDIAGEPMLLRVIGRARAIPGATQAVLATTTAPADAAIVSLARSAGVDVFAGSESDVLDRYYQAARQFAADYVVRVTADCPVLDPAVSGQVIARVLGGDVDYVTNCQPPTFPDGLDTEAVTFATLERAWREATLPSDREHVTPYVWRQPELFRTARIRNPVDLSALRWTVDDERDLAFIRAVYERLGAGHGAPFGMDAVLALLAREPGLRDLNSGTGRNEGYDLSLAKDRTSA